jgi:serine-type D-Ala-D-Ala endopeptidase (penicillin-binding protein 7)
MKISMTKIFTFFVACLLLSPTAGYTRANDEFKFKSNVAYIIDADTQEVLHDRNSSIQVPIASITKLMAAIVVLDREQDLDEKLTITKSDIARKSRARSKLAVGTKIQRKEALLLGLMSSENRSMNALARTFPGGHAEFIKAMNEKARSLGMNDTHYVDPTGVYSQNVSSAKDLFLLMNESLKYPLIKEYSTTSDYQVTQNKKRQLNFVNTNPIVRADSMDILLQKTGYITAAGRCLIVQAKIQGRNIAMIFLNSKGKNTRFMDAKIAQKSVEKLLSHQF